ncbi:MAG: SH3 domain-containing protein [Chloroflexi bacterium]|nr:SH3 domain-containing protein [Chloroflexota bacterium]
MLSWLLALNFLLFSTSTLAQDQACPELQMRALANIVEACAEQEAGTLCLGQATVTPVLRPAAASISRLVAPGDTLAIDAIDWLSVSDEDKTWGAARALFPAFAGDGLEARTAALLASGNVALFLPDSVEPPATLADVNVTAAQGANLRALPDIDAPVIATLAVSRALKAIGRSPGGAWLLVYATPDLRGWISDSVVSASLEALPALAPDEETVPWWLPGQRFDFRSGLDDAPCAGAPGSGILLQTPKFIPPRAFQINGTRISLSGAAWLQAQVSSGMFINVIDGGARVVTAEGSVSVRSGKYTTVALYSNDDGGLLPASAPATPQPYAYHELVNLPIDALPYRAKVGLDVYTIAEPAPADGGSPLDALSSDAPCKFAALLAGANIRSRPDPDASIIAVLAHRESAAPVARAIGADSLPWWKLADSIWVRVDATVSAGNCNAIPLIRASA